MTKDKLLKRLTANDEAVMIYVNADIEHDMCWIVDRRGFVVCRAGQDKATLPLINTGALVCVARQWPSGNYIMRPAPVKDANE